MTKIGILISGRGSNMATIAQQVISGNLKARIAFVGSDRAEAEGLKKAKELGLKTLVLPYAEKDRSEAELALDHAWSEHELDWLVLAGFMKILSPSFVKRHRGRIVNIHPALLPSFPGTHGILDAWNYGVKVTGVTVHLVDEEVDHGRILSQETVTINDNDTLETLEAKIHAVEHKLYWETLREIFD